MENVRQKRIALWGLGSSEMPAMFAESMGMSTLNLV